MLSATDPHLSQVPRGGGLIALMRPHAPFLCALLLVIAINSFVRLEYHPLTISTDAYSYMDSAKLIRGEVAEKAYPGRLLKPLAPIGIALLAPVFDGDYEDAFIALNVFCYVLLGLASYALFSLFTDDRFLATLLSAIFISTYPVLLYGLDLYSEMGAWALYVLTLWAAIRYYRDASWKHFCVAVLMTALGLLWKEYAVPAGIFFGLLILAEPTRAIKEKLLRIVLLGVASLSVMGIMGFVVYAQYQYTLIDFLREAASTSSEMSQYTPYFIGKSLFGVFLLGWVMVAAGLWYWRSINKTDRMVLYLLLPPSLMFFLWTFVSSRLYYIVAPLLAIIALHGMRSLTSRRWVQVLITVVIVAGSYAWLFASEIVRDILQGPKFL